MMEAGSPRRRGILAGFVLTFVLASPLGFAPIASAQNTLDILHAFGNLAEPATPSHGRLLEMPGGALYGTTSAGDGTIYKLTPDGLGGYSRSTLYAFRGADGRLPYSGVIGGGDGYLYGTTAEGGAAQSGTVFRVDLEGQLTTLHSFNHVDGANPYGALLDGGDGFLYGTTWQGSIFKISKGGQFFQTLHTLLPADGTYPMAGLVRASDGFLYGTATRGGASSYGTLFRIRPDGTAFSVIRSFTPSTGSEPSGDLLKATDSMLYGVTTSGGLYGNGVIYRFDPASGTYAVVHSFTYSEGFSVVAGLEQGSDGWLYGTKERGGSAGGGIVFRFDPATGAFAIPFSFDSTSGTTPNARLAQSGDGYLYGTCSAGGPSGGGAVFRLRGDGSGFSILAALESATIDGATPQDGVVVAGGILYGTTARGGEGGLGTVYRISPYGGGYARLHSFRFAILGDTPSGPLAFYFDNRLYGTTLLGGTGWVGTVYRLNTDGSAFEVVHSFAESTDGSRPTGGVVDGGDGYLYGTASSGGANGGGTLFRLHPVTLEFAVLHAFPSGSQPQGSLLRSGSSLFGTTKNGGADFRGSIFAFNIAGGTVTTLYSFSTSGSDGCSPNGGLAVGPGGLLYGTAEACGAYSAGTVFRIAPGGSNFSVVHTFDGNDGRSPRGPLVLGGAPGVLYGTTAYGGEKGAGSVFQLFPDADILSPLYSFDERDGRGMTPMGTLLLSDDAFLYGNAPYSGGNPGSGGGKLFRLSPPAHVVLGNGVPAKGVTICRDELGPTLLAMTEGWSWPNQFQWGYRTSVTSAPVTNIVGQTDRFYTVNGADFPDVPNGSVVWVVCTTRFAPEAESVSNPVAVTVNAPCGGSALPPPPPVLTATAANGTASTTLHWVNPSEAVDEIVIRYRTGSAYPNSADDTSSPLLCGLGAPICGGVTPGAAGTFQHTAQTPGTTYSYAAFTRRGALSSGSRLVSARPFDAPAQAAWAYSTGATSVAPPGIRPAAGAVAGTLYAASNDRGLHAMTLGAAGGDWPAGWKPYFMNAPSQGRPIPVNFRTFTVAGSSRVVYAASQDGRVYVVDALTGALLRASAQLCESIQNSPGAMLKDFGGAYNVLIVGSRNTTTGVPPTNELIGLNPDTLAVLWRFDNGKGLNGIGIISGQPLVDYATNRVYFTSRQLAGGSSSTVWCLSFTETSVTKVWEANAGSVDASVTLSNGSLYVGNVDGVVYAFNASDGTPKWTKPFATGDGPVRSLVWSSGTGNRLFFSTNTKTWAISDNGPGTEPSAWWSTAPAVTSPANPLAYGGRVFVGSGAGQLIQLDGTTPTPSAPVGVTLDPRPAQVGRTTIDPANGVIYVGTDMGTVHSATFPF